MKHGTLLAAGLCTLALGMQDSICKRIEGEMPEMKTHVALDAPAPDGVYLSPGSYTEDGDWLKRQAAALQTMGYDLRGEPVPLASGRTLVRLLIPKETLTQEDVERIDHYVNAFGGNTAEVIKIGGELAGWNDLERKIEQTLEEFRHPTRGKYKEIVDEALRTVLPGLTEEEYMERAFLVDAVMKVESHYDEGARSRKGAFGLMQLMPHMVGPIQKNVLGYEKPRYTSKDAMAPEVNILLGTALLFDGNAYWATQLDLPWNNPRVLKPTLADYNGGRKVAAAYLRTGKTNRETTGYVAKVMNGYGGR